MLNRRMLWILYFCVLLVSSTALALADEAGEKVKKQLALRPHVAMIQYDTAGFRDIKIHAGGNYVVDLLSGWQLQVVEKILKLLDRPENIRELGRQIKADLLDDQAEHGGIVVEGRKKPFVAYPSVYKCETDCERYVWEGNGSELRQVVYKNSEGNNRYVLPEKALQTKCLAEYHFHAALEDETPNARPSLWINTINKEKQLFGDLAVIYHRVMDYTDYPVDSLVFSKLPGGQFNATYYSGYRDVDGSAVILVLDLGNYHYD